MFFFLTTDYIGKKIEEIKNKNLVKYVYINSSVFSLSLPYALNL